MKTLLALIVFLGAAVIVAVRKQGRREVKMLESGKMCIYCKGTDVTASEVGVVCSRCGRTTLWTLVKQPSLPSAASAFSLSCARS
jgi:hypothetical protein